MSNVAAGNGATSDNGSASGNSSTGEGMGLQIMNFARDDWRLFTSPAARRERRNTRHLHRPPAASATSTLTSVRTVHHTVSNKSVRPIMTTHAPEVATRKRSVLLIDDHPIVRQGLSQLINQEHDLHVVCGAASAREALDAMDRGSPDIAIVDISLDDRSGID